MFDWNLGHEAVGGLAGANASGQWDVAGHCSGGGNAWSRLTVTGSTRSVPRSFRGMSASHSLPSARRTEFFSSRCNTPQPDPGSTVASATDFGPTVVKNSILVSGDARVDL